MKIKKNLEQVVVEIAENKEKIKKHVLSGKKLKLLKGHKFEIPNGVKKNSQ